MVECQHKEKLIFRSYALFGNISFCLECSRCGKELIKHSSYKRAIKLTNEYLKNLNDIKY